MHDVSQDIYPMPAFPTLEVHDLEASTRWYQEALGFRVVFVMPGPGDQPVLAHLRWAKYADVLLRSASSNAQTAPKGIGITLTFAITDGSADDLAARARSYGARIVAEPQDQPWNTRDFTAADLDGFHLVFTQGPLREVTMEQIVANVQQR